jgi:hypothetical protein
MSWPWSPWTDKGFDHGSPSHSWGLKAGVDDFTLPWLPRLSFIGCDTADVRPAWHGHGLRTRERRTNLLAPLGYVAGVLPRPPR